jgi:hypothetical protein
LGDYAEGDVRDLMREIGPAPPSLEYVGSHIDRYLNSRFYPFDDAKFTIARNTIKAVASSEWADVLVFTAVHREVMSE